MHLKRTALIIGILSVMIGVAAALPAAQTTALGAPARQGGGRANAPDPRSMGGGECRNNPYNCADAPNPLPATATVWLEEMTWMDVRDALKAGKRTIIVPSGGIEPNGPWLALGKHNYIVHANCEAIARKLGDALCAPIIRLVPEGEHMDTPGTISIREETFQAMLTDVAMSLQAKGFQNIIFIGDSRGNQDGQKAVAEKLNAQWAGNAVAAHIPEYYDYAGVRKMLADSGTLKEPTRDGLHDDAIITLNMLIDDPNSVRYDARVKAGKATINGVSIADKARALDIAKKIVEFRATQTANTIKKAIANKGKATAR